METRGDDRVDEEAARHAETRRRACRLIDPGVISALDTIALLDTRAQNGHVCSGLMSHRHERRAFRIL